MIRDMLVLCVIVLVAAVMSSLAAVKRGGRAGSVGYWALVGMLVVFGTLTGFSIGIPFLLTGVALAVVARYRTRPAVFWPPIVAVLIFIGGFVVVAPLGCTATTSGVSIPSAPSAPSAVSQAAPGHTTCSNLVGIDYSGSDSYHPSLVPALLTGAIAAVTLGSLSKLRFRR
jgi:hypothetical protein